MVTVPDGQIDMTKLTDAYLNCFVSFLKTIITYKPDQIYRNQTMYIFVEKLDIELSVESAVSTNGNHTECK